MVLFVRERPIKTRVVRRSSSSSDRSRIKRLSMFEDNGNKCGKCQNHDFEILKKGSYPVAKDELAALRQTY